MPNTGMKSFSHTLRISWLSYLTVMPGPRQTHCSYANMLILLAHTLLLLPASLHAVAALRSLQAQLVVAAANGVTVMLIALMSVFS